MSYNPEELAKPEQTISELTEDDRTQLREQSQLIEKYLADSESREKFKTVVGKVGTIRAILEANVFKPNQTYELQCLGVVLGDAIVQELDMEWVIVEDDYDRSPAVQLPGTSIIFYPVTMISKRIENGEDLDVFDLFNWVADTMEKSRDLFISLGEI